MKNCAKCGPKFINEFNKNSSRKDGLQIYCKICQRGKTKNHYRENVSYYTSKAARRKEKLNKIIREAKNIPCKDCNTPYPYWIMTFDHLPGNTKIYSISRMQVKHSSIQKIKEEILKCEVVCSNCHANRTYLRSVGQEAVF